MSKEINVYLAGQSNEHDDNWKELFKDMEGFKFYDWEVDSDQTSPETFFPDDLRGIKNAHILVANPGIAPSEATWFETGYFYSLNTKNPGKKCERLIIIWQDDRKPAWSIEFIKRAGVIVSTFEEAKEELIKLSKTISS